MNMATAVGGAGYFDYWNNIPNYYSFNAGGWHFISLNSNYSKIGVRPPLPNTSGSSRTWQPTPRLAPSFITTSRSTILVRKDPPPPWRVSGPCWHNMG